MKNKTKKVHAEMEYINSDGNNIHSDICPDNCNIDGMKDNEYRELLHSCLDEWLDKSNGTGGFYIKEERYYINRDGFFGKLYD